MPLTEAGTLVWLRQIDIVSHGDGKENKENQIVVSTLRDTGYLRIESHLSDA